MKFVAFEYSKSLKNSFASSISLKTRRRSRNPQKKKEKALLILTKILDKGMSQELISKSYYQNFIMAESTLRNFNRNDRNLLSDLQKKLGCFM